MTLFQSYFLLALASLLPVIATAIFLLLDKYTKFENLNYWVKQVIFGVVFGGLAVLGTELGIPMSEAQVNCRDAAVLTAGFIFGWPAGLIAGTIGAAERWLAAMFWNVAPATRTACVIATFIAGIYSGILRKFFFKKGYPNIIIAFFSGLVMETFHLLMVFITNVNNPEFAYKVVNVCTFPMLTFNALSVMLGGLVFMLVEKKSIKFKRFKNQDVGTTMQISLLITCLLAFGLTSSLVYSVQYNMTNNNASSSLNLTISDLDSDICATTNDTLSPLAYSAMSEASANYYNYERIASRYNAVDINIVDKNGICIESLDPQFKGVDFSKREDTKQYMELIGTTSNIVMSSKYGKIPGTETYRKYIAVASTNSELGFIRVGFDENTIDLLNRAALKYYALSRHAGDKASSYCIITTMNYELVSYPEFLSPDVVINDIQPLINAETDKTIEAIFNKLPSYCQKSYSDGFIIFSTLGLESARLNLHISMYLFSFLQIIAYALLFGLTSLLIDNIILHGFKKVSASLEKISQGDLNVNVDVGRSIDFVHLSESINTTVDTLKGYIDEANKRIDKELKLAKDIQSSCLPRVTGKYKNNQCFDIYAAMYTAKEVGGDFYDFYLIGQHRLAITVADVSGKGIPASLFMMRSKQELKSLTEARLPIDETFTLGNKSLCEGNDAGMFVTAWQGLIDLYTGDVEFANAGHNAPLVYKASTKKFEYLKSIKGFVLAGFEIITYKKQFLHLDPGDIIFLYTDGVTEATNNKEELYGEDRLLNVLNSKEFDSMEELCNVVKADVDKFVGDAPQFDDITMVAYKFKEKM